MSEETDFEEIMAQLEAAANEDALPESSISESQPSIHKNKRRTKEKSKVRGRREHGHRRGIITVICTILVLLGLLIGIGWITTPVIQGHPVSILSPAVKLNNDFKQVVVWNNTIKSAMTTTFNYSFSLSDLSDAASTLNGIENTIGAAQLPSQFQPVLHAMIEEITYGLDINGYLADAQKGGSVPRSRMKVAEADYKSISQSINSYLSRN